MWEPGGGAAAGSWGGGLSLTVFPALPVCLSPCLSAVSSVRHLSTLCPLPPVSTAPPAVYYLFLLFLQRVRLASALPAADQPPRPQDAP